MMRIRTSILVLLISLAGAVIACGSDEAPPLSQAHLALRQQVDYPSYAIGLVVPNSAEIERVTGRAVAAIRAVEYDPGRHASFEALDSSSRVFASFDVTYGDGISDPLVPGGRLAVTVEAADHTTELAAIATEHATRLHDAAYEAPALPENLEPGLYLIEGLAADLRGWANALEAGDTTPASSGETLVLFGCNAGRSFETARWLFTSAPCLDAARAAWLVHDGDIEAARAMLETAFTRLDEIAAAFGAAIKG